MKFKDEKESIKYFQKNNKDLKILHPRQMAAFLQQPVAVGSSPKKQQEPTLPLGIYMDVLDLLTLKVLPTGQADDYKLYSGLS